MNPYDRSKRAYKQAACPLDGGARELEDLGRGHEGDHDEQAAGEGQPLPHPDVKGVGRRRRKNLHRGVVTWLSGPSSPCMVACFLASAAESGCCWAGTEQTRGRADRRGSRETMQMS